jgi:hypothetical protein
MAKSRTKKETKTYYFMNCVKERSGKYSSEYGETWNGNGVTPEEAVKNSVDEFDVDTGRSQLVFYFTLENADKRQTGFLKLTRTGLTVERIEP